jgi:adenylosuccinate lyase
MAREAAYSAVQTNAMRVWHGEGDFLGFLKADPTIQPHLDSAELSELFDLGYHFKAVDTVFARVLGA